MYKTFIYIRTHTHTHMLIPYTYTCIHIHKYIHIHINNSSVYNQVIHYKLQTIKKDYQWKLGQSGMCN